MLLPKDLTLAKVIVGRGMLFLVFLIRIRTPPLFPRFRWCLLTSRDQQRARARARAREREKRERERERE